MKITEEMFDEMRPVIMEAAEKHVGSVVRETLLWDLKIQVQEAVQEAFDEHVKPDIAKAIQEEKTAIIKMVREAAVERAKAVAAKILKPSEDDAKQVDSKKVIAQIFGLRKWDID